GASPTRERALLPRGSHARPRGRASPRRDGLGSVPPLPWAAARGADPVRGAAPRGVATGPATARVHGRPAGRLLPRGAGLGADRGLRDRDRLPRHGRDGRALGGFLARGPRRLEGPAGALLAELAHARAWAGGGRRRPALRSQALHRVRGHARERPLAHA